MTNKRMPNRMDEPMETPDPVTDSRNRVFHYMDPHSLEDRNDLESLLLACARELRHSKKKRFGSTQDRIVMILNENGGTMSQKTLQQLLRIQPGTISEILSKMEEKNLIERNRYSKDKRASLITSKVLEAVSEEKESFFEVLNDEEKENLKNLLKKVLMDKRTIDRIEDE